MNRRDLAGIISFSIIFIFSEQAFAWNDPPVADLKVEPIHALVGQDVDFDGSDSYDPDGEITDYSWRFLNGGDFTSTGTNPTTSYKYSEPDTYHTWLKVTDDGSPPASDSVCVYVYIYKEYGPIYVDENAPWTETPPDLGQSWDSAYKELSDALAAEDEAAIIYVAKGTYTPGDESDDSFELKYFMKIYGGFSPANGVDELGEQDPSAYPTILSGDIGDEGEKEDNSYLVVQGSHGIMLDGLTIKAGYNDQGAGEGAGLYCYGDAEIINCIFEDNGGAYYNFGGAVCNDGDDNTQKFANCVFSGNEAYIGGAVSNVVHSGTKANKQEFFNCVFTGNTADYGGGAVLSFFQETTFTNCTFYGNEASGKAGGVYSDNSTLNVTNSIFWGNTDGDGSTTKEQEQIYDDDSDVTVDYSCIEGVWTGDGSNNIADDPKFADSIDPDGDDDKFITEDDGLQLQCYYNNSGDYNPCIDTGDTVDATTDILGRSRDVDVPYITGDAPDMGAYESRIIFYVKKGASGTDGSSWDNAFGELRDALADTDVQNGGELWVGAGTYKPTDDADRDKSFVMYSNLEVYGGFGGDEKLRTDRDFSVTILSGDLIDDKKSKIIVHFEDKENVILDGFTITVGDSSLYSTQNIYCKNTTTSIIKNCIITRDSNKRYNGIHSQDSSPQINNCEITNFSQGIYGSSALTTHTMTIDNCQIHDNTKGISLGSYSTTVSNCDIYSNDNQGVYISNGDYRNVNVNMTIIRDNGSSGIYDLGAYTTISKCLIYNNSSNGIYCHNLDSIHSSVISNSVICQNDNFGIYTNGGTPKTEVTNCTVYNNGSYGLSGDKFSKISNCVVYGNNGTNDDLYVNNVVSYCCIYDIGDYTGNGNFSATPNFTTASDSYGDILGGDNEFFTNDDGLRLNNTNSPCIDTGEPWADCSNEPSPNGERLNLGAYGNTDIAETTVDEDDDTIPDSWEIYYWSTTANHGKNTSTGEWYDSDDDDYTDNVEFIFGYDPLNDFPLGEPDLLVLPVRICDNSFDPTKGQTVEIKYWTNKASGVDKTDLDFINTSLSNKTYIINKTSTPGENKYTWNGKETEDFEIVERGLYEVEVTVTAGEEVDENTSASKVDLIYDHLISDLSCNPFRIIATNNEITEITYDTNVEANLSVKVFDPSESEFRVIVDDKSQSPSGNPYSYIWSGKNDGGKYISEDGEYRVEVKFTGMKEKAEEIVGVYK